ncbi:MAG: DUF362 domain-containing protein [Pyrinomonadaceae bacterium]|nr:DUF362 domain-containing protein [Pyrinomonadaceae bacterium]
MDRREWLKKFGGASALFLASPSLMSCRDRANLEIRKQTVVGTNPKFAKVAFVKTSNRAEGVKRGIELLKFRDEFKEKNLFIKPNYNSAHETPGSTHNDILRTTMDELRELNAESFTIGDRSGMGDTNAVMREKDIFAIAKDAKAKTIVFDDLKEEDWEAIQYKNSHWQKGFAIPKPVLKADSVVNLCCLKTHQYGGHFTLSLKNSVGLAAKRVPNNSYNFMSELHSSRNQRRMIAEINAAYKPSLVVLDGVEAFTDGGPHRGTTVKSEVVLVGTDRVAIDAIGVAILRHFGTTSEVQKGKIFEQEQIAQAVKLGVGISSPEKIEFLTDDKESADYVNSIKKQFV